MATNNFNPLDYGAIPVQGSSGDSSDNQGSFDPVKAGGVPVASQTDNAQARSLLGSVGNGLLSTANYIEKPIASVVATPVQAIAKLLGQPDPYSNGMPNLGSILGQTPAIPIAPATPAGFLQKSGQIGQIGSALANPVSTIGKNLVLGGAMGLSNSIAAGRNPFIDPAQVARDTVWGSIFGSLVGTVGSIAGHLAGAAQNRTGVVNAFYDAISQSDPALVAQYANAGFGHGKTLASLSDKTPVGLMKEKFRQVGQTLIDKAIPAAGKELGKARKAAAHLPIMSSSNEGSVLSGADAANDLLDKINNVTMEMTGHGFGIARDVPEEVLPGLTIGSEKGQSALYQLPGREVQLSNNESKQLENLMGYLQRIQDKPTASVVSDMLINIKRDLGTMRSSEFGQSNSPVEGALNYAYGQIRQVIGQTSPEVDAATSKYANLVGLKDALAVQAGKEGQSGALMMRRVFSGDQSDDVVPVLNALDNATRPFRPGDKTTLLQHSALGRWATDMSGNESVKQLFAQGVKEGNAMSSGAASLVGIPRSLVNKSLSATFGFIHPDPLQYALSVAKGSPQSMNPVARLLDSEIKALDGTPLLTGMHDTLKSWGVNATAIKPFANQLIKYWIMQKLSQPKQPGFPLDTPGVPNTNYLVPGDQPQSQAPSQPFSSAVSNQSASDARSLTPQSTGQGMSSQSRSLGIGSLPDGMNVSNTPRMTLS